MSNLVSHIKSKKHIELQNSAGSYYKLSLKKRRETVNENVSDLQNEKKHVTFNSSRNQLGFKSGIFTIYVQSTFQSMFADNDAIKHFSLSYSYLINFGLAPYYKDKLLLAIKTSPFYSVLFDESMNSVLQEEQMNIHIRFWDSEISFVKTRYSNFQFKYRANQDNLYQSITRSIEGLPKTYMNQLSMDGPNTNWVSAQKIHCIKGRK